MGKLRNIFIKGNRESLAYRPINRRGNQPNIPSRNRQQHAQFLEKKFDDIWKAGEHVLEVPTVATYSAYSGIYMEVKGKEQYELITKSLEHVGQNVRLCNVRFKDEIVHATVFIPYDKRDFFLKKIQTYKQEEANAKLLDSIEEISLALVEALWVGEKEKMPTTTPKWCEVWLIYSNREDPQKKAEDFYRYCAEEKLPYKNQRIVFPERVVVGIKATKEQLLTLQYKFGAIAEIRLMTTPASFFISELDRKEQREWVEDLLQRTTFKSETSTVSICILDQGINQAHPLLTPVLKEQDMHTIFPDGITADHSRNGHGTAMAGIATYFDLEKLLESQELIEVRHSLESVRMLDSRQSHLEELYGAVTAEAILLPEIENPDKNRVICMPITSPNSDVIKDGRPSSWSGAIDNLAVGRYETEDTVHRLIFVSAGNTRIEEIIDSGGYEDAVSNHSVEDPGQAWNAITVGAYTEKIQISDDELSGKYQPLAEAGSYSPFTSTSLTWSDVWPIKPEIVLEGGNLAYSKDDNFYSEFEDLELLTTNKDFIQKSPFTTISMTSSATAQASWIAARILQDYPDLWPETVRALIVHSATWPEAMLRKILEGKKNLKRSDYRKLLRTVGYGVPNIERAIHSMQNSVNMIIEEELQPFIKENSIKIKEMHVHEIPWPEDVLLNLGETPVEMRVTLSYFIEPAPGEVGWKDKYRYPSYRLYFDVNNALEDKGNFMKRINQLVREESKDSGNIANDSDRWLIGIDNRNVGSIHSDIWTGTASELSESRYVAVYPGTGWWYTRPHLKRFHSKVKYSLVVSISTPDQSVDLYTPILTKINQKVPIKTEVMY